MASRSARPAARRRSPRMAAWSPTCPTGVTSSPTRTPAPGRRSTSGRWAPAGRGRSAWRSTARRTARPGPRRSRPMAGSSRSNPRRRTSSRTTATARPTSFAGTSRRTRPILVSVTPDGDAARGQSRLPAISADGRMVAFQSTASDLLGPAAFGARRPPRGRRDPADRGLRARRRARRHGPHLGRPERAARRQHQPAGHGRRQRPVRGLRVDRRHARAQRSPPARRRVPARHAAVAAAQPGRDRLRQPHRRVAGRAGRRHPGQRRLGSAERARRAAITGAARGDYDVVADGCVGRVLHRQDACTVTVGFTPSRPGSRPATLAVPDSFTGSPRTASLRGSGLRAPVALDPQLEHRSQGRAAGHRGRGDRDPGSRPTPTSASTGRWGSRPSSRPSGRTPAGGSASRCSCSTTTGSARATCARRRSLRARSRPCPRRCWSPDPSVGPPGFLIIRRVIDLPLMLLIRG